MNLENIPEVEIDARGGYKFVTCEIYDADSKKLVVRANQSAGFHRDIVRQLRIATGLSVSCLGGGRINVDPEAKVIKIWSSSGDFGVEPNRQGTTGKLLQAAYPDFKIEIGSNY